MSDAIAVKALNLARVAVGGVIAIALLVAIGCFGLGPDVLQSALAHAQP